MRAVGVGLFLAVTSYSVSAQDSRDGRSGGGAAGGRSEYDRAAALRDAGKCDKAIPKFYCLAVKGRGYEIAQNALGECLIRTAGGKNRANRYADGVAWIRRAANAGFADAQGTLVQIYLDGKAGADADPVEAALWYRLYQDNALRQSIGARPLAGGLEERLAVRLDEDQWEEAEKLAEGWRRTSMKPIILKGEDAAACRPKSILGKLRKRRPERVRPSD